MGAKKEEKIRKEDINIGGKRVVRLVHLGAPHHCKVRTDIRYDGSKGTKPSGKVLLPRNCHSF